MSSQTCPLIKRGPNFKRLSSREHGSGSGFRDTDGGAGNLVTRPLNANSRPTLKTSSAADATRVRPGWALWVLMGEC